MPPIVHQIYRNALTLSADAFEREAAALLAKAPLDQRAECREAIERVREYRSPAKSAPQPPFIHGVSVEIAQFRAAGTLLLRHSDGKEVALSVSTLHALTEYAEAARVAIDGF